MLTDEDLDAFDYRDVLSEEEIARAEQMTVDEVMEEGVLDLIKIGTYNGMTNDDVHTVLLGVIDKLAQEQREMFKLL